MNQPTAVFLFPNGNTAATDSAGEQIPELQVSWLLTYVEFLISKGVDPTRIEFRLPGGFVRLFKTDDGGWNWRFL